MLFMIRQAKQKIQPPGPVFHKKILENFGRIPTVRTGFTEYILGRSILQDEPMRFDPMDAVRNMDALDACLSAARERRRVVVATTV